ncbi:hypothetical protein ACFQVB_04675 [Paraburkholderia humisilvae]
MPRGSRSLRCAICASPWQIRRSVAHHVHDRL